MDLKVDSKKQIKTASLLSYSTMILQIFTSVLTTPYIVNRIGDANYGVYKVIASFVAYMTVLNFGLGTAALRYLSEYRIKKEKEKEKRLLCFVNKMNFIISGVVLILGVMLFALIPKIFGKSMSENEVVLAQRLFVILLVNIVVSIFTDKYVGIINAYEEFIFVKMLDVLRCISKIVLIFSVLYFVQSAVALTLIDLVLNLIIMISDKVYCIRNIGIELNGKYKFGKSDLKEYSDFLVYAMGIFTTMIINQLLWNVDSVVIGMRLGPVQSAIYAVGTTFSSSFFNASIIITNMLLPKVVRMQESGADENEYTKFTTKVARIQAYIIFYMYIAFIVYGKEFIYLWMGENYGNAWSTALLVMSGTLFSSFVITVQVILRARKKQAVYNWVHLIIFSLNAIFTYYAVGYLGINGAALMTFFTYLFGYVFIMYPYYCKIIKVNIPKVFWGLIKGIVPAGIFIGILSYVICMLLPVSWFSLIIGILIYTLLYVVIMYFIMNQYERDTIKDVINRLKK